LLAYRVSEQVDEDSMSVADSANTDDEAHAYSSASGATAGAAQQVESQSNADDVHLIGLVTASQPSTQPLCGMPALQTVA